MKDGTKKPLRLSFIDIKKAYFNGVPTRDIYMSLPPELGLPKHFVAKQTRCVYGTRDAGMIWEQCYRNALEGMGFTSGISNPCLFHHPSRDIAVVVHGDDFTAMATDDDLDWYTAELEKVFEIKVRGRLGEGLEQNEIRILNRIVRVTPQGVRYEADPRHYELLSRSLGLEGASATLTPGVKPSEIECETFKGDEGETEGPVMDVTGRISSSTIGVDGHVLISENDGTDTVRKTSLEDILSGKLSEQEGKTEKRMRAVQPKSNSTGETSVETTSAQQQLHTTGKTSVARVTLQSLPPQRRAQPDGKAQSDGKSAAIEPIEPGRNHLSQGSNTINGAQVVYSPLLIAPSSTSSATLAAATSLDSTMLTPLKPPLSVTFSDDIAEYEVTAYSDLYEFLPKDFVIAVDSSGHTYCKLIGRDVDYWTGKSSDVMKYRIAKYKSDLTEPMNHRKSVLRQYLNHLRSVELAKCRGARALAGVESLDHHFVYVTTVTTAEDELVKLSQALCAAVRTQSAKAKFAGRKGAKAVKKLERLQSTSHALSPEEATMYRALSARANYLAQDRPDIAFSTKELCREFAVPNKDSYGKLKRVVRFLIGLPRLVYCYDWQETPSAIDVYTDTDFAGCKTTRRSTSGGTVMFGNHCVRHWATTQTTLSLSSGEAELHGIGKGIAQAMGLRSLYADLGVKIDLRVHSDATAAIGIARRRGLGKLRHLDCEDLWIQAKVREKEVTLIKVLGAVNPADILTKYLDRKTLDAALITMRMVSESGRAASAPQAAE